MDVGHTQHGHTDPLPSITIVHTQQRNHADQPNEQRGIHAERIQRLAAFHAQRVARPWVTHARHPVPSGSARLGRRKMPCESARRSAPDASGFRLYNCISAFFHQTYIWKIADNHAISRSTHTTSMYDVHLHYWTVVPGAPRSELMPDNMSDNMTDGWIAEGHSAPQTELSAASRRSSSHS